MEGGREVKIDDRERFLEFQFADFVEFRDRLVRVGDRLQKIGAFAAQKIEPLFALVVFLERHHVDRAHGLDPRF